MKYILLFLLSFNFIISNAQIIRISSIVRPVGNAPLLIASTSSLSGFSTTAGFASSSQNFTISGSNLTASALVTAPTGYEVSLDNSNFAGTKTVSQSGGSLVSQPVTLYTRITSSASGGTVSGNIIITSTGATPKPVGVSGTVISSSPSVSTSVPSLTGFSSNLGSASTSQSFTLSGSNLTADIIISSSLGCETSLDNSSFSTSTTATQSGGSVNTTVYVRLSTTASAGSYSGTVSCASTGATTKTVNITGSVTGLLSDIFNFSASSSTVAGAKNVFGDPTLSPSFNGLTTGWTLAVRGAAWTKFGGSNFGGLNNGSTAASSDGTFTQVQIASNLYNIAAYSSSAPQLEFTNLPAGTYEITMLGSILNSIFPNNGNCEFHVVFGTGVDNFKYYDPNNGTSSTGNITTAGPGAVTSGTFTGTITSGQTIKIWVTKGTAGGNTGVLGYINALEIVKTN